MSTISVRAHTAALERSRALSWRDEHTIQGRADLWRLMQQVDPLGDTEISDLLHLDPARFKVDETDAASRTPVIEFKRLCLQNGVDPQAVIKLMKEFNKQIPEKKKLEPGLDPVGTALGLPIATTTKAVWVAAFFAKFASAKGSEAAQRADAVMENTQTIERALIVLTLLHDGYQIVRGSKEIVKLKEALTPVKESEREALENKLSEMEDKLNQAMAAKAKEMDLDFFKHFHDLMMLKCRLEPNQYQAFRKLIKAQIEDAEKSTQECKDRLKETVKLAVYDITDVVLEILDPSGLLKSGVGLVVKTQGLYAKILSAKKTIAEVRKSLDCKVIAQEELNSLIQEATETKFVDKRGEAHVKMLNTAAKLNRCFWESQKQKHVENVSLKTLGVVGGVLGFAGVICKILAIVSIAAGATALMASSFGLAGVIILALVIAFKAGIYLYKHRSEISCQLEVFRLQIAALFAKIINKAHGKWTYRITQYDGQIHRAKCELELARLSMKIGHIGIARLRKLATHHFRVISQQASDSSSEAQKKGAMKPSPELSTRVFKAITGKAPKFEFEAVLDTRDLQDRFVASVIHEMMA